MTKAAYGFSSLPLPWGGALPTPTFPTAPQLNLYHSETYPNGFCTCLLLIKCLFVTHWGSYSVPCGASVSKKQTTWLDIGIFPPDLMLLLMSFSFIKSFHLLLILFIAEPLVIWKLLLYSWEMKDFAAVKYKWSIGSIIHTHSEVPFVSEMPCVVHFVVEPVRFIMGFTKICLLSKICGLTTWKHVNMQPLAASSYSCNIKIMPLLEVKIETLI